MMICYNECCIYHDKDFAGACKNNMIQVSQCNDYISQSDWFDKVVLKTNNRDPKSKHYDAGGISTLDIIKAKLTPEQYKGWLLGNVIKYSCRMNFKGQNVRDADKLAFYSMWLNEEMTEDDK